MLWFIIFPIVFALIGALIQAVAADSIPVGAFCGAVLGCIVALLFNAGFMGAGKDSWRHDTEAIYSIATATAVQGGGGGFLFAGTVESQTAYMYYTKKPNGSYIRKLVTFPNPDDMPVWQTASRDPAALNAPRIEQYYKYTAPDRFLSVFSGNDEHYYRHVKIYVPEGSVVQTYKLTP